MKYFFYTIVLLVVGFTVYFTLSGEDHTLYIQEITELREIKDNNFRTDTESPIKEEERSKFTGLKYFDVDPEFKVQAKIEKNTRMEQISLGSSTGNYLNYLVFGYAVFKIDGNTHRLMLLQETGPGSSPRLFLPFSDQTSANETYGGVVTWIWIMICDQTELHWILIRLTSPTVHIMNCIPVQSLHLKII